MMSFPPEHFVGTRVTVMGLGHFGGQISAVRFLVAQGAEVTVTDLAPEAKLKDAIARIADLPVQMHLGGHIEADFTDTDLVVVSPAVPKNSRYLKLAIQKNIPITSEMNLFLDRCRARVLGVTGTVGKSTTVAMIETILREALASRDKGLGFTNVWLGGNIGKSLLEDVAHIQETDLVILELSSFQLEDIAGIEYSPEIALVTNIFPNHLDRHDSLESYIEAKSNITRFQRSGDVLITNANDANCRTIEQLMPGEVKLWHFARAEAGMAVNSHQVTLTQNVDGWILSSSLNGQPERIIAASEMAIPGEHNLQNAAAASAAALAAGVSPARIGAALRRFKGLADRLELVAEIEGTRWYNDSKSTTPQSGIVALRAFPSGTAIAIVGGYDKQLDLSDFARDLARRAKLTVALGQTGPRIAAMVRQFGGDAAEAASLEEAVSHSARVAGPGDCVLLSPGCASWDMFENYQARGQRFRELVSELNGSMAAS